MAATAPRDFPLTRVWTRPAWSTSWVEEPNLEPLVVVQEAAPGRHQASFRWRAGRMRRPGDATFIDVSPRSIRGHWVKIEHIAPDPDDPEDFIIKRVLFVGRFAADDADEEGLTPRPVVTQELTAFGFDHELDTYPIDGSYVGFASGGIGGTLRRIHAGQVFNEPLDEMAGEDRTSDNGSPESSGTRYGNRSSASVTVEGKAVHYFSPENSRWTALDAVEHLLYLHWQKLAESAGSRPDVPALPITGQLDVLAGMDAEPFDASEGSVLEALQALINPRRGVAFTIRYGSQPIWKAGQPAMDNPPAGYSPAPTEVLSLAADLPSIYVFTITEADIPSGPRKNPHQLTVDPAPAADNVVRDFRFGKDASLRYGKIIVLGERIVSCFTLSFTDATLKKGWTSAEETLYKTPGGADAPANDERRKSEALSHVFARFVVGDINATGGGDWLFTAGDGEAGPGSLHNVNPLLDANGELVTPGSPNHRRWCDAYRVLPHLPLRGVQGLKSGGAATNEPRRDDDYRPLLVVAKGADGRWFLLDRGQEGEDQVPSADIRPLRRRFGFEIKFPLPHIAALSSWSGAAATDKQPLFDYNTILATVAVQTDGRLRVERTIAGGDPHRILEIDVRGAHFHWVDRDAVLDVSTSGSASVLWRLEDSGLHPVIRNDAPYLRQIAAQAEAWFGVDRQVISYHTLSFANEELILTASELQSSYATINVGAVVTSTFEGYDAAPVNTPITQLVFDCEHGRKHVRTRYQELSFT